MSRRDRSTATVEASSEGLAAELAELADASHDDDVLDLTGDGPVAEPAGRRARRAGAADAGRGTNDEKPRKKKRKKDGDDLAPQPEPIHDEVMHHGGALWSLTVAVSLSIGLLVSGSSLLSALEGSGDIGAALIRLALVSTVAMVGISGLSLLFHMFSMPVDEAAPAAADPAGPSTAPGTTDATRDGA